MFCHLATLGRSPAPLKSVFSDNAWLDPSYLQIILCAVLAGWGGIKALLRPLFIWRAGLVEYVVSFALIPVCALTVLLSLSLASPAFEPGFLASDSVFATIAPMLLLGLAVGLIEETGWTSFATSRLLHGRGVFTVAIGLGTVHGFWHLPVVVLCGWHLQSKTFFEAIGNLSDTVLCSACSRGAWVRWP